MIIRPKCLYMKEFCSSFDENAQLFLTIVNRFENFAAYRVDSILENLIYKFLIIATIVKLEKME